MSIKPTNKTKQTMLDIGLTMLKENGIRNFSVRKLTERANINTGSFVYHFGNREAFIQELTQQQYHHFLQQLVLKNQQNVTSIDRFKGLLLQVVDFVYDNSDFISQLLVDLLNGENLAQQFIASTFDKHPKILFEALKKAQQDNYVIQGNTWEMLFFIMAPIGMPVILMPSYKNQPILSPESILQLHQFLSKKQRAIQTIEWSLKGLSPAK